MASVFADGIELAAAGQVSSENGGGSVFDLFTSLGDVIQNTGDLIAGTTETVFGAIRRVEDAIDGRGSNPSESGAATSSENVIQRVLPSNIGDVASTNNLLIAAGVGLGIAGLVLAIRG